MGNRVTVGRTAAQAAVGVAGLTAVTLVCFRLHVQFAIAAFLYLLILVLWSPAGGFAASAIVSLVAVLCLDYFFTPPILQLEVASPIDGIALLTYLVTSLIITRLAAKARQKAITAERQKEALRRLYQTAWRLFAVDPQSVSAAGTLEIFREVLGVEAVCLLDGKTGMLTTAGNSDQELP